MNKKILTLYISIILMTISVIVQSQELGLNFIQSEQHYNGRNSAAPYPKKTIIGLPDASANLFNEAGGFENWINNKNISVENLWASLDNKDYTATAGWSIRSLSFGKKYKKFQWGISHSFEGETNIKYHKDLVGLIAFGNYGLLNKEPIAKSQPISIAPNFNTILYQSFHLESAFFLSDDFSIGGGLKLIGGIFNTISDVQKFDLDIRDPFVLKTDENWIIKSSNLISSISLDSTKINRSQVDFGKNPGIAFNLGFYKKTDNIKLSAQIRDLGFVKWNGNTYSRSGTFNYSGVQINDILTADKNIFNQITDTLKKISTVIQSSTKYSTSLRSKVIVDILYSMNDKFSIGGAALYRFNLFDPYWKIAGTALYTPSKTINIGSQLSFDRYSNFNIGLYGALNISILRLYGSIDHLPVLVNPNNVNRFSGNVGLAIMW